jgi:hypothetical protein
VTGHIWSLLGANVVMLALGCGLLPFLRLARTRRELLTRAPLGYAVGIAATGVVAANLAIVDVPIGRILLPVLAVAALVLGIRRVPASHLPWRRPPLREVPALGLLAATLLVVVPAARLFAVKPLSEFDGWAIWAARARALYEYGHPISPVFTDAPYPALQHPLFLPALEAVDFRFMGAFDGTTVHLQLLGLAVAFVGGTWTLLRPVVRPLLLAATLLALVCVPSFFIQLQTNYADIPLAMFVALGVAALAAWLSTGAEGLLPAAALFLAAAVLTKSEGECFAVAAFAAAFMVSRSGQRRPLLLAAGVVLAADLPWRIWVAAVGAKSTDYTVSNLFDPSYLGRQSGRVGPVIRELWSQIWNVPSWSHVVLLVVFALAGAAVLRRFRLALFGAVWLLLSFGGLVAIYWISQNELSSNLMNSSHRTIASLVIGGGLLVPVLLRPDRGVVDSDP